MPKCSNCAQFQAKNTDEDPEVNNAEVDEAGRVTAEIRIVNTCEGCSEELEESTFELEVDLTEDVRAHRETCKVCSKNEELSVDVEATRSDETKTVDRKGRKIRNPRYFKRFYGVDATATVTTACGATFSETFADSVQASGMESLV